MEFFRLEYWSGFPFPPPGDLPDPGIEPVSPALAGGFFTPSHLGSHLPPLALAKSPPSGIFAPRAPPNTSLELGQGVLLSHPPTRL